MTSTYQSEGYISLSFKKPHMDTEMFFYSFTSDYTMDKLIKRGKEYCAKLFKKSIEWK